MNIYYAFQILTRKEVHSDTSSNNKHLSKKTVCVL